jgi:hypothetical protein
MLKMSLTYLLGPMNWPVTFPVVWMLLKDLERKHLQILVFYMVGRTG